MEANHAPLVDDLFIVCYGSELMKNLSKSNALHLIKKLYTTKRFIENIDSLQNLHFLTNSETVYMSNLG